MTSSFERLWALGPRSQTRWSPSGAQPPPDPTTYVFWTLPLTPNIINTPGLFMQSASRGPYLQSGAQNLQVVLAPSLGELTHGQSSASAQDFQHLLMCP